MRFEGKNKFNSPFSAWPCFCEPFSRCAIAGDSNALRH